MTLVVRNEADILEANLDYHLAQGVDFVIVTDHGSVDDTAEILRRYERDGVVHVINDDAEGHQQSARVTRMAQLAATRYPGAWIIHNDADEFWWPLAGSLRDVFASIPEQFGQVEVPRNNFLPRADGAGTFHSRLVYREASSLNPRGLPLEAKVAHRAGEDVEVAPGNHAVFVAGLRPVPGPKLMEIFHFPMRSFGQFEQKVVQTGTGYEKLPPGSPEVGRDQMILLELQRKGELRDYYEQRLLDDARLAAALADGSILVDRRLDVFMSALGSDGRLAHRPDSAQARALVADTLALPLELERCRWDLKMRRQELDHAIEQIKFLGDLNEVLNGSHEALESLQASRLMRWSAPVRRAYYRARRATRARA